MGIGVNLTTGDANTASVQKQMNTYQENQFVKNYAPEVVGSGTYAPRVPTIPPLNTEILTYGNSRTMKSIPLPNLSPKNMTQTTVPLIKIRLLIIVKTVQSPIFPGSKKFFEHIMC